MCSRFRNFVPNESHYKVKSIILSFIINKVSISRLLSAQCGWPALFIHSHDVRYLEYFEHTVFGINHIIDCILISSCVYFKIDAFFLSLSLFLSPDSLCHITLSIHIRYLHHSQTQPYANQLMVFSLHLLLLLFLFILSSFNNTL